MVNSMMRLVSRLICCLRLDAEWRLGARARTTALPFDFWVNHWPSVNLTAMGDEVAAAACCTP
jgi:hypothetical protein